jgi:hypothetical protein
VEGEDGDTVSVILSLSLSFKDRRKNQLASVIVGFVWLVDGLTLMLQRKNAKELARYLRDQSRERKSIYSSFYQIR